MCSVGEELALQNAPTPHLTQRPHPPCPQVVKQVVANLGLFLIQFREKVQKQREAAVVLLHLAEVPRWGRRRASPRADGEERVVCPLNTSPPLKDPEPRTGTSVLSAKCVPKY